MRDSRAYGLPRVAYPPSPDGGPRADGLCSLGLRTLLPPPSAGSPRVTGSSRPRPLSPARRRRSAERRVEPPDPNCPAAPPGRRLPARLPAERLTSAARGGRLRRHRTPNMAAAAQAAHIRSADGDGTGSGSEREQRAASSRRSRPRRQPRSEDADSPGHPPGLLHPSRLP